jgi:hypothetical protein
MLLTVYANCSQNRRQVLFARLLILSVLRDISTGRFSEKMPLFPSFLSKRSIFQPKNAGFLVDSCKIAQKRPENIFSMSMIFCENPRKLPENAPTRIIFGSAARIGTLNAS